MFIEKQLKSFSWADSTMSQLKARRLKACEQYLAGLPDINLFDANLTDLKAEELFELSWNIEESHETKLHRIEDMRNEVLSRFHQEIELLSPGEHELLVRLILFGGRIPLYRPENCFYAASLVRRLWASVNMNGQVPILRLPTPIFMNTLVILAKDAHKSFREIVNRTFDDIENCLYLYGILRIQEAVQIMDLSFQETEVFNQPEFYLRALKAEFDTFLHPEIGLCLVHPGLANPSGLIRSFKPFPFVEMKNGNFLPESYDALSNIEDPLFDRLLGLIQPLVRADLSAEEILEDLIVMVKQGAPVEALQEVLSARIITMLSSEMKYILSEMVRMIPRWASLGMGQVQ